MEAGAKRLKDMVNMCVLAGMLRPIYEVEHNSYVCYIMKQNNGGWTYHVGMFKLASTELQKQLLGAYLNETVGPYKVTGIYDVVK